MSFWVVSGHHGLFGVNDYTHLLRGFLSGDCYFTTFGFWVSHRQSGSNPPKRGPVRVDDQNEAAGAAIAAAVAGEDFCGGDRV